MKADGSELVVGETGVATLPRPEIRSSSSPSPGCLNCGTELSGPYCAQCGQHVADYHRSVWRFVADFFDNTFCWDNKLLRTLVPLFRHPGFLTNEFMAGRRVRYVHPLRLFLFTSAACLALLHFGGDRPEDLTNSARRKHAAKSSKAALPTPANPDADTDTDDDDTKGKTRSTPASAAPLIPPISTPDLSHAPSPSASSTQTNFLSQIADAIGTPTPAPGAPPASSLPTSPAHQAQDDDHALEAAINHAVKAKLGNKSANVSIDLGDSISEQFKKKVAEKGGLNRFNRDFVDGVRHRLSWVSLAMLPIFALLLRGLYWRRDTFYFLHLVFSLHYHTFLLLFWTGYSWLSTWLNGTFLQTLAILLLFSPLVYLYLALRRVYGDGVRRTWLKAFLLGGMHLLAIICGLAAVGALSFFSAVQ